MFAFYELVVLPFVRAHLGLRGVRDDRGASLVEYAFLLGLIVIACISAITLLGEQTSAVHSRNADAIVNAGP
jgi:Flp pilus assembly pilin Flp